MRLTRTFAETREGYRGRVALVPTMGYLHEGHLSLVERARRLADTLVVSVFVNPLQFNDAEDLDRYPRDLERDARLLENSGVDLVFAPSAEEVYPATPQARVVVTGVTDRMEGAHRPGHFDGVATVVAKLFAGLQPDVACFGRKDAQQLAVITTMTRDLSFPVEIVPCPTVREPDGLALSSRNVFLGVHERERALAISAGLFAAADAVEAGARDGEAIEGIVKDRLGGMDVDYVELAAQDTAERLDLLDRPAFLAVAARVGATRLIDNVAFDRIDSEFGADRGARLSHASTLGRS